MADTSSLCGSSLYSNITICKVMEIIDEHIARAETELANANQELDALGDAVLDTVGDFNGVNYVSATQGIPSSYATQTLPDYSSLGPAAPSFPAAPSTGILAGVDAAPVIPAAYTVPAATDLLISAANFDAAFAREEARVARLDVKAERDAMYNSGRQGIGKASASLSIGLKRAQEETALNVSGAAQNASVTESVQLREDVKALHGMHIQNWPLHPQLAHDSHVAQEDLEIKAFDAQEGAKTQGYNSIVTGLASAYDSQVKWVLGYLNAESDNLRVLISGEAERRNWSQMAMNTALAEAEALTKYAIEKMEYLAGITRETQQARSQLVTGAFQALISAANVNLSGSGGQSVVE